MKIQAHIRKDPQKGKKGFSKNKGFTLIELMIAVGVLAVIMSLALPSYRMLIEKRQVTSSAQQVAAFLSSAKMEAVKRNQNVRLSKTGTSDANWCVGFSSYAANDSASDKCDCTVKVASSTGACSVENLDTSARELKVLDASRLDDRVKLEGLFIGQNETDVVSFDPIRGMLTVNGSVPQGSDPLLVQLTSQTEKYALNVRVSATGRVTMCSAARGEYAVPGYDDC